MFEGVEDEAGNRSMFISSQMKLSDLLLLVTGVLFEESALLTVRKAAKEELTVIDMFITE